MSTRGAIARTTGDTFKGVYNHFDSYPEGLGKSLFELYRGFFDRDLKHMLTWLIDAHPAGWSSFQGTDFRIPCGYGGAGPQCYCHGERSEDAQVIDETNAADCGAEYVYAFNEETRHMFVLSSYNDDGSKMIGMFGSGNPDAKWRVLADVNLEGREPDWAKIGEEALA